MKTHPRYRKPITSAARLRVIECRFGGSTRFAVVVRVRPETPTAHPWGTLTMVDRVGEPPALDRGDEPDAGSQRSRGGVISFPSDDEDPRRRFIGLPKAITRSSE